MLLQLGCVKAPQVHGFEHVEQGGSCVLESCATFTRWDPIGGSASWGIVESFKFITQSYLWSTLCFLGTRKWGVLDTCSGLQELYLVSSAMKDGTYSNHEPKWIPPQLPCPDYLVTVRRKLTTNRDEAQVLWNKCNNKQQIECQLCLITMTNKISDGFIRENIEEQRPQKKVPSLVTHFYRQLFPFSNELCARSKQYEIHS